MSSTKYTPTITKQGFDAIAPELWAALRRRFEVSKADAARPEPNPATKGAFDHVPILDSKTVARWSSLVKDYIGCKLDPSLIRKGGYESFEAFQGDLEPKLRATCPDTLPASPDTLVEAMQ